MLFDLGIRVRGPNSFRKTFELNGSLTRAQSAKIQTQLGHIYERRAQVYGFEAMQLHHFARPVSLVFVRTVLANFRTSGNSDSPQRHIPPRRFYSVAIPRGLGRRAGGRAGGLRRGSLSPTATTAEVTFSLGPARTRATVAVACCAAIPVQAPRCSAAHLRFGPLSTSTLYTMQLQWSESDRAVQIKQPVHRLVPLTHHPLHPASAAHQ
jgi:hypothetical protein